VERRDEVVVDVAQEVCGVLGRPLARLEGGEGRLGPFGWLGCRWEERFNEEFLLGVEGTVEDI